MRAVKIDDLDPRYREQVRRQLAGDPPAVRPANVERGTRHEPLAKKKAARPDGQPRVRVRFISYRHNLTDSDGCCGKYVLDALVSCGVLGDDSPEFVESVSYYQCKINKGEEERTEVKIEPCYPTTFPSS